MVRALIVFLVLCALLEIVEMKKDDLNAFDPDQALKIIAGTARSMGLEVEG